MDLDSLIRNADPVRESTPPAGTSAIAQWTYVQIRRPVLRPPRLYARPRLVFTSVVALAVVLAIGDILIGPNRPRPSSSAAAVLRHAAAVVSDQTAPQLGHGQYLYAETKSLYQVTVYGSGKTSKVLVPLASAHYVETQQTWADVNGAGRGLLTRGPLQFTSGADKSAWEATPAGQNFSFQFTRTETEPSLRQVLPDVSELSSDPNTLTRQIAEGINGTNVDFIPSGSSAVFQRAARLLVGPDLGMTTGLSSALYQVMANQVGVDLLGATTDHLGRQGIGLSLSSPSGVSELIIDATTGSALEIQYSPPASSIPASTKGPTVHCSSGPICGKELPPLGSEAVEAPVWSDTVTSGVVNSIGSTQPNLGAPNA
jgi:hypothetical protein